MDKTNKTKIRILILVIIIILFLLFLFVSSLSLFGIIQSKKKMNVISLYPEWYEYVSPAFENTEISRCQLKDNTIRVEYKNTTKGSFDDKLYIKLSEEFINNNPNYFPNYLGIEVMEADPNPIMTYLSKIKRLKYIF